jgi:beta-glucosidase
VKEEEGGGALEICLQLANTGEREGTETVQLYLQDRAASLVRPVKELKDYAKVTLKAGEKKTVRFRLPKEDMGFYDNSGNYLLEDGLFKICAGGSSRDCLEEEIMVKF